MYVVMKQGTYERWAGVQVRTPSVILSPDFPQETPARTSNLDTLQRDFCIDAQD